MAIIIREAPMIEIMVSTSFNRTYEIAVATSISDKSRIVEVEAEMCFKPSSHK